MNYLYLLIMLTGLLTNCSPSSNSGATTPETPGDPERVETLAKQEKERKPTATVSNKTRQVTLHDPYMQNAEVLTMDCLPGWQIIGRVDQEEFMKGMGSPNIQVKGSDGTRQMGFYFEQIRSYYDEADGVPEGQRHPLLQTIKRPYTTAGDYLDFVAKTQFPDAESVELVELVDHDKLPPEQQTELQKFGQTFLDAVRQGLARSAMGSGFAQILNAYPDMAIANYKVKPPKGDAFYHTLIARFFVYDLRMPYGTMNMINRRYWSVIDLRTATAPDEKALEIVGKEMATMCASVKLDQQYQATINAIKQGRNNRMKSMIMAGIARNQEQAANLSRQLQENANEISDIQMSMYESTSAMQDRVTALQSEAIREVNPYVNSDGTVVDIPIGSGSQVWSNSDASTIYSSDSYFFNPNIGSTIEYQQMQLLR